MQQTIKILKKACKYYDRGETLQLTAQEIGCLKAELKTYPEALSLGIMDDSLYDLLKSRVSDFNDLIDRYKNERGKKVQHLLTRGSLNKVDVKQAAEWLKTCENVIVASKLDGMSIILRYEDGMFKQAITRGDGIFGSDCTRHFINSSIIPQMLCGAILYKNVEIRGELCVPKRNQEQLKHIAKEIYNKTVNSARNIVVGVVNGIEPQTELFELFEFRAFELSHDKSRGHHQFGKQTELVVLANLGFNVVRYARYVAKELRQHNCAFLQELCANTIANDEFECDGIVIYQDLIHASDANFNNSLNPKYARKFKDTGIVKGQMTTIRSIEWKLSDKGRWNAVAVFDELIFDGVKIKKATLNNMEFIKKLNLGIGSRIEVVRGGGVIPKIIASNGLKDSDFELPLHTICRGAFLWDDTGDVNDNK